VPLDDRTFERFNPDLAGRPQLIRGNSQLLFPGMRVSENCVLTLKNKSYSVTADIIVPKSGATGVIITQGGLVGGWSLYAFEGRLKYCYNFLGIDHFLVTAGEPIPAGKHQVRMEFKYDGGGLGKGGDVTLYYDGKSVGQGRVERTQPMIYSADEACDVGADTGSPASPDYGPTGNKFSGEIDWGRLTSATTAKITSSKPRTGSRSRWHGNNLSGPRARRSRATTVNADIELVDRFCRVPLFVSDLLFTAAD
jgi:hypothetical protein